MATAGFDFEEELLEENQKTSESSNVDCPDKPQAKPKLALTEDLVKKHLQGCTNRTFSFYQEVTQLEQDLTRVEELSKVMHQLCETCIVTKSKLSGIHREALQTAFFEAVSGNMAADLNTITRNHQLSMWLSLKVFEEFLEAALCGHLLSPDKTPTPVTLEEADIATSTSGFRCVEA